MPTNSAKQIIQTIKIIHLALIFGQLIFASIAHYLVKSNFVFFGGFEDPFIFIVPSLFLFSISGGKSVYKKLIEPSFNEESLIKKLSILRTAIIVRYAITEAAVIMSIVAYIASMNFLYIILAALMIGFFVSLKPKKDKIEIDLKIDYRMKAEFEAAMS